MNQGCKDCKYSPDNLIWTDVCNKKVDETYMPAHVIDTFLEMRESNKDNNCKHYKSSLEKKINNFFDELFHFGR